MGTKLPRKLEQKMALMGEQIKLARLRRNLSIAQVAERATCSPLTVARIEKGSPTVSIGIYARVLYALQLDDDLLLIAHDLDDIAARHDAQLGVQGLEDLYVAVVGPVEYHRVYLFEYDMLFCHPSKFAANLIILF